MCDQWTVMVDPDPMGVMLNVLGAWGTVASLAAWMTDSQAPVWKTRTKGKVGTDTPTDDPLHAAQRHVQCLHELQILQQSVWRVLQTAEQDATAVPVRLQPRHLVQAAFCFGALHLNLSEDQLSQWSTFSQSVSSMNRRATRATRELLSALTLQAVPIPNDVRKRFADCPSAMNRVLRSANYAEAYDHFSQASATGLQAMAALVTALEEQIPPATASPSR